MRAFIAATASFCIGVALAVGDFHVPRPIAETILGCGCLLYVHVFLTWPQVNRRLYRARKVHPVASVVLVGLVGFTLFGGAFWWIFRERPPQRPDLFATVASSDYPPETVLAGIKWSNSFSELTLAITNPGPDLIEDVDLTLRPDRAVVEIAQKTDVPSVSSRPKADITFRQEVVEASGKRRANPLVLIGTTSGISLGCPALRPRQRIELLMAIATIIDTLRPGRTPGPQRADGGIFDRDYVLKMNMADGTAQWYGHGSDAAGRIEDVFYPREVSRVVNVEGSYRVGTDRHQVSEQIETHDLVAEAAKAVRSR